MNSRLLGSILRSAWPSPSIDNLLRAALLADEEAAASAWRDFETAADFDHLTAGEMRLIGLVAGRLPASMLESPMRARIAGIGRANWSRSQLSIGDAGSGLRALAAASVDMLAIKGAARAAAGGAGARSRMINDVDIVVRPHDMRRAFDLLIDDGWLPAGSGSVIYHRTRLADAVGVNLVRGRFGNLDLHRTAFHPPHALIADDGAIWTRSVAASIAYAAMRVPGATDGVAIALAHGALDAHKSSDWLADITAGVDSGVDWDLFEAIAERRRLAVPAAVVFRYIRERLERPIPEAVLARLEGRAVRRPAAFLAAIAEIRPKGEGVGLFWLLRAVAKQTRLLRTRQGRHTPHQRIALPMLGARDGTDGSAARALEQPLAVPARKPGEAWSGMVDLVISIELPPVPRRLEFEVNAGERHVLRLRGLAYNRKSRERSFRFKFPLSLSGQDADPVLVAAACRRFNATAEPQLIERYGATPFALTALRMRKTARGS